MRLIFLAELTKPVSIDGGGGVNKIVSYLTEGLIKKGHEVILLASGDSKTSARLIPVIDKHLDSFSDMNKKVKDLSKVKAIPHIRQLINSPEDIIVNHLVWRTLLFSEVFENPIVTTLHNNPLSDYANEIYKKTVKGHYLISLSLNQKHILESKQIKILTNIYNGIPVKDFSFEETAKDDYLFYLGRISKGKGLDEIMYVAEKYNKPLKIAGDKDDMEEAYFAEVMGKISTSQKMETVGELSFKMKNELLASTRYFLFPVQWEEPFGLVVAEAMACGTPVIAYARGSMPELIQDGINGFLVNQSADYQRTDYIVKKTGIEGLCEAVERMYSMPEEEYRQMRKNCREHVEKYFSVERMVDEYEKVYREILSKPK